MKYIGENAIKKLISLIKDDLATKQPTITASGLLKGDGTTISAAVAETDYMVPPIGGITGQVLKKTETGTEWADESGGSSSNAITNAKIDEICGTTILSAEDVVL